METKMYQTTRGAFGSNGVEMYENYGGHNIDSVKVKLESSTSTARAMNIAMKILALDWSDQMIDEIEGTLDARIKELALGNDYTITGANIKGREHTMFFRTMTKERAIDMFNKAMERSSSGPYIVSKVDEFKREEK